MIAKQTPANAERDQWFENLIATLSADKFMLDTDTATPELKSMYGTLMEGNADKLAMQGKELSQHHFISRIVFEYLSILRKNQIKPEKLAFDLNDTEVLVWAEISDNQEELEKQLILAEAQVNARYHQYGYDMTSMIVERGDLLPIPNHYSEFRYKA